MTRGRHAAALAILVAVVSWLFADLATDEEMQSHEGPAPYARTRGYLAEMQAGQWPPQVFPETVSGGGSAFPYFYPPAAYSIASLLSWAAGDVFRGVNAAFAASVLLSAVLFYGMAFRMSGSASLALLGAVLYASAPYRFFDIFVRGALAECWTFVWYPPIALGMWRAAQGHGLLWYLPVSFGALMLTHTVMSLYAIAWWIPVLVTRPRQTWRPAVATVVLGAGLAAWHVLPMYISVDEVRAGIEGFLWSTEREVRAAAPSFRHLWAYDPLRRFAITQFGAGDLGVLPVAVVAAGLALRRNVSAGRWRSVAPALVVTVLWASSIHFVLQPEFYLQFLPGEFRLIQFPWRMLGPAAFLAATAIVLWLSVARDRLPAKAFAILPALAIVAVLAVVATVPAHRRDGNFEEARTLQGPAKRGFTALGEYLPIDLTPEDAVAAVERARAEVTRTPGVTDYARAGSTTRLHVRSASEIALTLPLLHYNFYGAEASNGAKLRMIRTGGLLGVQLPSGDYDVRVQPRVTTMRWIGIAMSVVAAFVITARGLRVAKTSRRVPPFAESPVFGAHVRV